MGHYLSEMQGPSPEERFHAAREERDSLRADIRDFFTDLDRANEDQHMRDALSRFRALAIRRRILPDPLETQAKRARIDAEIERLRAERAKL